MKSRLIAEIKLFLIIFIAVFVAVFIAFNITSLFAQLSYAIEDETEERGVHILPVVDVENSIYISKTKTFAPMVTRDTDDPKILLEALKEGVLLYPGSAEPGTEGSTVILGHSSGFFWSDNQYKTVFALLNKLEESDTVVVYFNNEKFIYRISGSKILDVNKANEAVNYSNGTGTLFLSSCWPIGTDWNRIVVTAELID